MTSSPMSFAKTAPPVMASIPSLAANSTANVATSHGNRRRSSTSSSANIAEARPESPRYAPISGAKASTASGITSTLASSVAWVAGAFRRAHARPRAVNASASHASCS
ncbi:MAG TPA: hypothetical protein VF432_03565 [Thermoanaerobaculia bacterium]